MPTKKSGLGRGLNALLGDAVKLQQQQNLGIQSLPIEFLQAGKYQPRKSTNLETLQELAESIKSQGIIQPIIVRLIATDKYEIIAGERRWKAAGLIPLTEVPVIIKDIDDNATMAITLIENIQREDLSVLEEAEALKRLVHEFNLSHQQIAQTIGKSRATISNLLRLNNLQKPVKILLTKNLLEMGHARALLALPGEKQIEIANKVAKHGMNVRATEKIIQNLTSSNNSKAKKTDPDTLKLQMELSEKVGTKVVIEHQKNGKGKLVFYYTTLAELEGIVARINY